MVCVPGVRLELWELGALFWNIACVCGGVLCMWCMLIE